ncbi:MAG: hypothetical protein RL477_1729 [Pseudomonadota bacterium]|jgi:hypothetical protein
MIAGAVAFASAAALHLPPAAARDVAPEIRDRSDRLDVPFEPSTNAVLDGMFAFARPTGDDYIIDLGSGDGRIVNHAVSRFGARGHGIDLNEDLVRIANDNARRAGISDRAKFHVRDLFKEDLSKATIITAYLLPEVMIRLRPALYNLRPGTRIVSHDYHMGAWRSDDARPVNSITGGEQDIVYFWKVPAKIAGIWNWKIDYPDDLFGQRAYQARIVQHWQDFEGRVDSGLLPMRIYDARIDGEKISFSITGALDARSVRQDFAGIIDGNRIRGAVTLRGALAPVTFPWSAYRSRADN